VLSALAGCKILRELSKLETDTETKLSMKELAQTFENLAHGGCQSSQTDFQFNRGQKSETDSENACVF